MTARKLDGLAIAATIKDDLRVRVETLTRRGIPVGLGSVLVGDDPGSSWYVNSKHKDCAEVGISSLRRTLPLDASQQEILDTVAELNENPDCTGYIVQLPLPPGIEQQQVLEAIAPDKDADGLHPVNLGRLVANVGDPLTSPVPCTPRGCIELLERNGIVLRGKRVLVIGRGLTVGRPIGLLLTRRGVDATVVSAHTATVDLAVELHRADVVIAAAGSPYMIKADEVRPGAIVLDVGVSRVLRDGKSRVTGDVDPDVADVASFLSPNPGGVGPMTRAMLLTNVVEAAERRAARIPEEVVGRGTRSAS